MGYKADIQSTRAVWNRFVPVSYDDAVAMLARDMPPDTTVRFSLEDDGDGILEVYTADGKISDDRTFSFTTRTVEEGDMRVQRGARGQGLGRKLMRNEIEFFYLCGFRQFDIYAGSSAGGYAWARMGFLPTEIYMRDTLEKRCSAIAAQLPLQASTQLRAAIAEGDLWQIADMQQDAAPALTAAFNAKAGGADSFSDQIVKAAQGGAAVPLGKAILAGTTWDGRLEFNNTAQMARVADYVGGLRLVRGMRR